MALKLRKKDNRNLARLVTGDRIPCAFCLRDVDDEVTYGKLYAIGDIQCHYFCCLLSCCLIQKGNDEMGLFGFMYPDIVAEVERCKKHKCSYCGLPGANLGCSVGACRKQFHLPCGREKNAVSLYYGTYKSFCQQHAPRQKIPEHIMANAKQRKRLAQIQDKNMPAVENKLNNETTEEMVCVICYESVEGYPTVNTFWPVCCGKDAWFHRTCLQRMALSAGMHYLKCPLCNDKESFYDSVVEQGYYVPDRDAAWELEQNAFAEIYERPATCCSELCLCPLGRSHDAETGQWDIKLCLLCGSAGAHAECIDQSNLSKHNAHQSEATQELTDQSDTNNDKTSTEEDTIKQNGRLSIDQSNTSNINKFTTEINAISNKDLLGITTPNKCYASPNKSNISPISNTICDLSNTFTDKLFTTNKLEGTPNKSVETPNKCISSPNKYTSIRFVCRSCLPAAPEDLSSLASSIETLIQQEQAQAAEVRRPIMPSRMSIRRTKGSKAILNRPSTSRPNRIEPNNAFLDSDNIVTSRLDLNLKTPRRKYNDTNIKQNIERKILSPIKLLEQSFKDKMVCSGLTDAVLNKELVDTFSGKLKKPRPMCERKRLVNNLLDDYFDALMDPKQKETPKKWNSPKKYGDNTEMSQVKQEDSPPTSEETQDKENNLITVLENISKNNIDDKVNVLTDNDIISNGTVNYSDDLNNKDITSVVGKSDDLHCESKVTSQNIDINQNATKIEENANVTRVSGLILTENINTQANETAIQEITKNVDIEQEVNFNENTENCQENCQNNDIHIEEKIITNQNGRTTRHSPKTLSNSKVNTKNKHNKSNNTENRIKKKSNNYNEKVNKTTAENKVTEISDEIKKDNNDISKMESNNEQITQDKNDNLNKTPLKINFKKHRKSHRVEKSKNKNQKFRSKSESSDISIFKKHLTEKELCSQLLLELTTGKIGDQNKPKSQDESDNENNEIEKKANIQSNLNEVSNFNESFIDNDKTLSPNKSHKHHNDTKSETPKSSKKLLLRLNRSCKTIETSKSNDTDNKTQNPSPISKSKKSTKDSKISKNPGSDESPKASKIETKTDVDKNNLKETPKHKTIDIQQDSSLEISENDQHINIDVIKIEDSPTTGDSYKKLKLKFPNQLKTCFKFSPTEDTLDKTDIGIDLESFKKEYLNEVDREFKCNFKHKHEDKALDGRRYLSPIDFAIDAAIKKENTAANRKRKLSDSEIKLFYDSSIKKRKTSESDLQLSYDYDKKPENSEPALLNDKSENKRENKEKHKKKKIKDRRKSKKSKKKSRRDENIEVTIDSTERRRNREKSNKKIKTKFAIRSDNIRVKIQCKIERISKTRKEVKLKNSPKLKQYVLQFPEGSSKEILVKPEKEVCPLKRKYVKHEKSPDKFKQMSIQSFFKAKPEQSDV